MIKERISLSGDLKSKVKQLMIYAGWYEGRKVDISIASQYYAERGVPMMKSTRRFYHKYFGLCCQWYFSGGIKRAAAFLSQVLWVMLSVVFFWWNKARRRF